GNAAGLLDLARDQLAKVFQMHMARHELGEGIGNGNDRLAEPAPPPACCPPQRAGAGHVAAMGGGPGAIGWHNWVLNAVASVLFVTSTTPVVVILRFSSPTIQISPVPLSWESKRGRLLQHA